MFSRTRNRRIKVMNARLRIVEFFAGRTGT